MLIYCIAHDKPLALPAGMKDFAQFCIYSLNEIVGMGSKELGSIDQTLIASGKTLFTTKSYM